MASMEMSLLTLPTHLLALVMDEFPQAVGTPKACQWETSRVGRYCRARFSCCKIAEDINEEGTLDEVQACRSFQQSLESLRRCTRTRRWLADQDLISMASVDSV